LFGEIAWFPPLCLVVSPFLTMVFPRKHIFTPTCRLMCSGSFTGSSPPLRTAADSALPLRKYLALFYHIPAFPPTPPPFGFSPRFFFVGGVHNVLPISMLVGILFCPRDLFLCGAKLSLSGRSSDRLTSFLKLVPFLYDKRFLLPDSLKADCSPEFFFPLVSSPIMKTNRIVGACVLESPSPCIFRGGVFFFFSPPGSPYDKPPPIPNRPPI